VEKRQVRGEQPCIARAFRGVGCGDLLPVDVVQKPQLRRQVAPGTPVTNVSGTPNRCLLDGHSESYQTALYS